MAAKKAKTTKATTKATKPTAKTTTAKTTTAKTTTAKTTTAKTTTAKTTAPKAAPAAPSTGRAFEHGEAAYGARFVRPGAARSPALDLAFALGHGTAGGIGPVALLPDLAVGKKSKHGHEGIARNVAIAALRAGTTWPQPPAHTLDPAPISEDEARTLVKKHFHKLGLTPIYWHALEAMVGPACLVPAVVEGLDAISAQNWDTGRLHGLFPLTYGLLLRAPTRVAETSRDALETLFRKRGKSFAGGRLDVMLHGREGIARRGYKYSPKYKSFQTSDGPDPASTNDLLYCENDAEFVASQFAALWRLQGYKVIKWMTGPSPARLFWLGGDATLETELLVVDRYPGTMQAEALASYQDLASPLVRQLIRKLAVPTSKVKAAADAWLATAST